MAKNDGWSLESVGTTTVTETAAAGETLLATYLVAYNSGGTPYTLSINGKAVYSIPAGETIEKKVMFFSDPSGTITMASSNAALTAVLTGYVFNE